MLNNISNFSNTTTAKTCIDIAKQRAFHLAVCNSKNILELCVGPSLKILENEYSKYNMIVSGNDIQKRWKNFYPNGNWKIGDCFDINWKGFDTIVFGPPLSRGC